MEEEIPTAIEEKEEIIIQRKPISKKSFFNNPNLNKQFQTKKGNLKNMINNVINNHKDGMQDFRNFRKQRKTKDVNNLQSMLEKGIIGVVKQKTMKIKSKKTIAAEKKKIINKKNNVFILKFIYFISFLRILKKLKKFLIY